MTYEEELAALPAEGPERLAHFRSLTDEHRIALVMVLTRQAWEASGRTWPPPRIPRHLLPVRKLTRAEHDAERSGTFEEWLRDTPVEPRA